MIRKRWMLVFVVLVLVAGAAILVTSPVFQPAPSAPVKVKIAGLSLSSSYAVLPIFYAQEKGFFLSEALEVEYIHMAMPSEAVQATLAGQVEFNSVGPPSLLAALDGAPLKIVMSIASRPSFYTIGGPDVKSLQDLRGKTIGVGSLGSAQDLQVREALLLAGLDPSEDVKIIQLGGLPEARVASFKQGKVDAISEIPPYAFMLMAEGYNVLIDHGKLFPNWIMNMLVTTQKMIDEKPEIVEKMVRAIVKGMDYAKTHKEESVSRYMDVLKIDQDLAGKTYDDAYTRWTPEFTYDQIRYVVAMQKKFLNKPELPPEQLSDMRFIKEVLGQE